MSNVATQLQDWRRRREVVVDLDVLAELAKRRAPGESVCDVLRRVVLEADISVPKAPPADEVRS